MDEDDDTNDDVPDKLPQTKNIQELLFSMPRNLNVNVQRYRLTVVKTDNTRGIASGAWDCKINTSYLTYSSFNA